MGRSPAAGGSTPLLALINGRLLAFWTATSAGRPAVNIVNEFTYTHHLYLGGKEGHTILKQICLSRKRNVIEKISPFDSRHATTSSQCNFTRRLHYAATLHIIGWLVAALMVVIILYTIFIVSVDENAVLSCAIYDLLIIRDHIADSQFTYNEVQTMIDDLCIA